MNVRVTSQAQVANSLAYIQQQTAALTKYQNQASSGLKVAVPSDDPAAYALAAQATASGLRYDTYTQTAAAATATLNDGVSALQQVDNLLTQAKQIALSGANATTDQAGEDALATQLGGVISQLVNAANTQVDGKYLFGGTATTTAPFRVSGTDAQGLPTGVTYAGSSDAARAVVGQGRTVETRYAGDQVFQRPGADVFQTLIGLRDDLSDATTTQAQKSQALNLRLTDLGSVGDAVDGVTGAQSSDLSTLSGLQTRLQDLKLAATTRTTDLTGTDYADAIVKMQQGQTGLQATLAVSSTLFQTSLLDFIR